MPFQLSLAKPGRLHLAGAEEVLGLIRIMRRCRVVALSVRCHAPALYGTGLELNNLHPVLASPSRIGFAFIVAGNGPQSLVTRARIAA